MFGHHRRRSIFTDLRLEGYGLVRGIGPSRRRIHNIRAAWAEAEVFVIRQLRKGTHPDLLEREIDVELRVADRAGYRQDCLRYARRILMNLRNAGQFEGLPTFVQLEQIRLLRPGRASYEMMMYDWFRNFEVVTRYGGDLDIAREIARARALDSEALEELQRMRDADRVQLEDQYQANEATLRAELQEARFRAEAAETRLRFEQQQRQMDMMPAAGNTPFQYQYASDPPAARPPYQYAHVAIPGAAPPGPPPVPNQYSAMGTYGGSQYGPYRENQAPQTARDNFQPQRPYQPSQYQQQDDYQLRNGKDPGSPRASSEYSSTIYSDDSYYRRHR